MFDISACVSLTQFNQAFEGFSQLINAAELACAIAKDKGLNQSHIYSKSDQLTQKHENMMQWISRINVALEENRFQLYRQKILGLQAQVAQEEHYEVLIRLKNEEGEILAPFHFLPAAERFSLMPKIDRWVIQQTFKKIAKIYADDPAAQVIYSVNLSGQSFCEEGFVSFIRNELRISGIPSCSVCFEVTETAAISNLDFALRFMEDVKKMGCKFSLDDFGSGMSSFTYLKNLPVDYLKIDGYFVKALLENKIDRAMVEAIHHLGTVMGLKTIAEFVENAEIMTELTLMGVDYGQGYGIGKPEPF
jgi:EAL domain-containing protein (putative c-di-GMP-specific phosphodiesterase class I)